MVSIQKLTYYEIKICFSSHSQITSCNVLEAIAVFAVHGKNSIRKRSK